MAKAKIAKVPFVDGDEILVIQTIAFTNGRRHEKGKKIKVSAASAPFYNGLRNGHKYYKKIEKA